MGIVKCHCEKHSLWPCDALQKLVSIAMLPEGGLLSLLPQSSSLRGTPGLWDVPLF